MLNSIQEIENSILRNRGGSWWEHRKCPFCERQFPVQLPDMTVPFSFITCCKMPVCRFCFTDRTRTCRGICIDGTVHNDDRPYNEQLDSIITSTNNTYAMVAKAFDLRDGTGGRAIDKQAAYDLFVRAANGGDIEALHQVGMAHYRGHLGRRKNVPVGVRCLTLACKYRHPMSNFVMAEHNEIIGNVKKDVEERRVTEYASNYGLAVKLYHNAACYGCELAVFRVHQLWKRGGWTDDRGFERAQTGYLRYLENVRGTEGGRRMRVAGEDFIGRYY